MVAEAPTVLLVVTAGLDRALMATEVTEEAMAAPLGSASIKVSSAWLLLSWTS